MQNNKIRSFYPFYFPLASFPFYKVFGCAGLYLIPLLSAILTMAALFFILKSFALQKTFFIAAILFAFASPVFFYSLVFWEMSLSVFFFSVGLVMALNALRGKGVKILQLFCAGIFLGLCSFFREEGYLLLAALVFSLLVLRKGRRDAPFKIVAGWLLVILPVWIFQYFFYGHILGLHAAEYNSLDKSGIFSRILGNFYVYLFKGAFWACLPVFLCAFLKNGVLKVFASMALIVACVIYCLEAYGLFSLSNPILSTLSTQALFLQSPFLLIVILSGRALWKSPNRAVKFTFLLCLTYVFLACLTLNRSDIGIIWGPRHFLFLYPLLVPLTFYAVRNLLKSYRYSRLLKRLAFLSVAILFLISLGVQFFGIRTLYLKKKGSQMLIEGLDSAGSDIVLTDIFWLPEEASSIYFKKKFMSVNKRNSLESAVRALKARGVDKFVLVLSKKYRRIDLNDMKKSMASLKIISGTDLKPPGMNFMEIHILLCEIRK